jgi:hypothetical protein
VLIFGVLVTVDTALFIGRGWVTRSKESLASKILVIRCISLYIGIVAVLYAVERFINGGGESEE